MQVTCTGNLVKFGLWFLNMQANRHKLAHRHDDCNILQIIRANEIYQQISSWMTANLLTLNSSKTEFLLIGLKTQLVKTGQIKQIST